MDFNNLRQNHHSLIEFLRMNGYSQSYIGKVETEIKRLLKEETRNNWSSYRDIYNDFVITIQSSSYLRCKRTVIGMLERFDIYSEFPDGQTRHHLTSRNSYDLLNEDYRSFIDLYCELERLRGKRTSTIYTEAHNASTFLLTLQKRGISIKDNISEKNVLSFFISDEGGLVRRCSYKKNIKAVFKACSEYHPDFCKQILSFLPLMKEDRKNIQYLKPAEIKSIKAALAEKNNLLTLWDKAIGYIILYTGLRGCDVANLTLKSTEWDKEILIIKQRKTEILLKLPLLAIVGNAIYDYLIMDRPSATSSYLFLRQNKPYEKLKDKSIGNIATKIMRVAGIRTEKDNRKGFHIFRHHLATSLLENDVPLPVISRTLGHTTPESLNPYLAADFSHLKECALSIEHFPVMKEVFENE